MQRNRLMLEETRDIVTVPASMIIRMLGKLSFLVFTISKLNLDPLQLAFTPTIETTTALIIRTTQAVRKDFLFKNVSVFLEVYVFVCALTWTKKMQ